MEEHAQILGFLRDLEACAADIQTMDKMEGESEFIHRIEFLSRHLLETERHHIREEIALLTRLAEAHHSTITVRLRKEHDVLGVKKRQFSNLVLRLYTMYFQEFKQQFSSLAEDVIAGLRDHIEYEDQTIYPLAYQVLSPADWEAARSECDRIGYCCFTPGEHHHLREINTLAR